jgi:hypothetical protein
MSEEGNIKKKEKAFHSSKRHTLLMPPRPGKGGDWQAPGGPMVCPPRDDVHWWPVKLEEGHENLHPTRTVHASGDTESQSYRNIIRSMEYGER